jgi:hypothetical protein
MGRLRDKCSHFQKGIRVNVGFCKTRFKANRRMRGPHASVDETVIMRAEHASYVLLGGAPPAKLLTSL